jgi:hypothetical protein
MRTILLCVGVVSQVLVQFQHGVADGVNRGITGKQEGHVDDLTPAHDRPCHLDYPIFLLGPYRLVNMLEMSGIQPNDRGGTISCSSSARRAAMQGRLALGLPENDILPP